MVPAWNEGLVIGATIERLLALDYPAESLRIFVDRRRLHRRHPRHRHPKGDRRTRTRAATCAANRAARARPTRSTTASGSCSTTTGPKRCSSWTPTSSSRPNSLRQDDAAPRRPEGRRRVGVHRRGQPRPQLHDALHRDRVRARAARRRVAPRTCSVPTPASRAAPSCTRAPTSKRSAARSPPAPSPRTPSPPSNRSCTAAAWCSSRTPSCWPRSRAPSTRCGSSGCAGRAATCRSSSIYRKIWFRPGHGVHHLGSLAFGASLVQHLPAAVRDDPARRSGCVGLLLLQSDLAEVVFRALWIIAAITYIFSMLHRRAARRADRAVRRGGRRSCSPASSRSW